jgi:hypothetical protein
MVNRLGAEVVVELMTCSGLGFRETVVFCGLGVAHPLANVKLGADGQEQSATLKTC